MEEVHAHSEVKSHPTTSDKEEDREGEAERKRELAEEEMAQAGQPQKLEEEDPDQPQDEQPQEEEEPEQEQPDENALDHQRHQLQQVTTHSDDVLHSSHCTIHVCVPHINMKESTKWDYKPLITV